MNKIKNITFKEAWQTASDEEDFLVYSLGKPSIFFFVPFRALSIYFVWKWYYLIYFIKCKIKKGDEK